MGFWNFSENRRFFADFWSIFWNFRNFLDAKSGFSKIFRKNPENFLKKKWKNLIGNKGIFGFLKNSSIFLTIFWVIFYLQKIFSVQVPKEFSIFWKKSMNFSEIFRNFFVKPVFVLKIFKKRSFFSIFLAEKPQIDRFLR